VRTQESFDEYDNLIDHDEDDEEYDEERKFYRHISNKTWNFDRSLLMLPQAHN